MPIGDKPFPMPPGWNSNRLPHNAVEPPKAVKHPEEMGITDDETMFIFKKFIKPLDYQDPTFIRWLVCYLDCRNTAQAAHEVGWTTQRSKSLRARPDVHACIEAITMKATMKHGYDVGDVVERVKEISELDPIELQNPDGSWKNSFHLLSPEIRRAIKKLKVKNVFENDPNGMRHVVGEIIEIEFYDKMEAHRLLAREKGTFKETKKIEHDVTKDMRDVLLESATRAEERRIGAAVPVVEIEGRVVDEPVKK